MRSLRLVWATLECLSVELRGREYFPAGSGLGPPPCIAERLPFTQGEAHLRRPTAAGRQRHASVL
ncbi:MAG TPA: hypothetical protein VMY76_04690, partial [Gemmatimonadales bacterium]|nr:hypothetical protein [Gemmatimonadales bacterium]